MRHFLIFLTCLFLFGCSGKTPQAGSPDEEPTLGSPKSFTVSAGPDQVVPEKTQIVLSGEVAPLPDEGTYSYSWKPTAGSRGSAADESKQDQHFFSGAFGQNADRT